MVFTFSIYLFLRASVPLCLCVQYKGLTDFSQSISDYSIIKNEKDISSG